MIENWKLKKSIEVFRSRPFNILEKTYVNPCNNKEFNAHILDVKDWANIIGIDNHGNILLIRQFRFGNDQIELEIPGGYIEFGETPEEAAIRELREETGFGIQWIKQIGVVNANPAIMNNRCYTFLAELSEKGDVEFDPNEIIESVFATPKEVEKYLIEGKITNTYVICGFFWYVLYEDSISK
ncbi:MAG: NUDIX hydrolase [Promethearchaeota archaeon]|nr:MAG: NUDIX hydrolase [Candidatus Lokiarchaeota archaeon]